MKVEEIEAKSIIVASKLPDADYVINPYTGCQFGCLYCYASFMGRFVQESRSDWGNYVYVKKNAVELAQKELTRWSDEKSQSTVLLSSVTDPYQGIESKYQLTKGILQAFVDRNYPGCVSILTKSPMVIRDLELLKGLPNTEVGITITTTDDRLSRFLEVAAPLASRRLETLKELNEQGVSTYAFVGPLLPHFRYHEEALEKLFSEIARAGVQQIYVEHINLPSYVKERLWKELRGQEEHVISVYESADTREHQEALNDMVNLLTKKYGLHIRLGGTIHHKNLTIPTKSENMFDIRQLISAALQKKAAVKIQYQDFEGNTTTRIIEPLEWNDFDQQKIRAYCRLRESERSFVISRIVLAELLN